MKKKLVSIILVVLFFASCSNDDMEPTTTEKGSSKSIRFTTTTTKVTGSTWDVGDEIGVVMKKAGQIMTYTTVFNYFEQASSTYKTYSGDGIFDMMPDQKILAFPEDGSAVDIVAFYPNGKTNVVNFSYMAGMDTSTYSMTPNMGVCTLEMRLSDQNTPTSQTDLDLMYSNNLTNKNIDRPQTQLHFVRKMSKLELNITPGEGLTDADLVGLQSKIYGPSNHGIFNLTFGRFDTLWHYVSIGSRPVFNTIFYIMMRCTENGKFGEVTLFPEVVPGSYTQNEITRVEFTLKNGEVYIWALPDGITFKEGGRLILPITLEKTAGNQKVATMTAVATSKAWVSERTQLTK